MENNIAKRIDAIIKQSGVRSKSAFAKKIGYKDSVLERILSGKTQQPTMKLFVNILNSFPDIDAHWLLTGERKAFSKGESGTTIDGLVKLLLEASEENKRLKLELQKVIDKGYNIEHK